MSISIEQKLENIINSDEPDYSEAAKLGSEAIPYLDKFIESKDPLLASKAVYVASLIDDNRTASILKKASKSEVVEARVATAHSIKNIIANKEQIKMKTAEALVARSLDNDIESLTDVLNDLKNDSDDDVRNAASKTLD